MWKACQRTTKIEWHGREDHPEPMHTTSRLGGIAAGVLIAFSAFAADEPNKYQVTGQVVEVTEKSVIIQKGDEKWELARKKSMKGANSLKVGEKVTIYYHMVADEVIAKPAGKAVKAAKGSKAEKSANPQ